MDNVNKKKWKLYLIVTIILSVILGISEAWIQGYILSPYIIFITLTLPIFIISILTIIVVFLLKKYSRKHSNIIIKVNNIAKKLIVIWLIFLIVPIPIVATNVFNKINTIIAKDIINAINQYYEVNGYYPNNIEELVPKYLERMPKNLWGDNFKYEKLDFHEVWNKEASRYDKINVTKFRIKNSVGSGWYVQIYDSYENVWFLWD